MKKSFKTIVFLLLMCILLIIFIKIFSKKFIYNSVDLLEITDSKIYNNNFVINIKINDVLASYDKKNSTFFYSNSSALDINTLKIISNYKTKYLLKKGEDNNYDITIFSDKYYLKAKIIFVNNPIMNVFTFPNFNKVSFRIDKNVLNLDEQDKDETLKAAITFTDNNFQFSDHNYVIMDGIGAIKVRGATSRSFPKKSYRLYFDKKVEIFSLDNDNDWILDALYSDKSKIRNKLSGDFWNLINDNQTINNDLKGEFVELFIDNDYKGLYVIKNNVDKKTTGISDSGLLIKSIIHNDEAYINNLMTGEYIVDENNLFLNMEIKNYNAKLFAKFISNLKEYYSNPDYSTINNIFDMDNYINYKVFIAFICGQDNVSKNFYYSIESEDTKMFITPWDLDLTWGLEFSNDADFFSLENYSNYNDYIWMNEFVDEHNAAEINEFVRNRYWELRKNVINMNMVNSYLNSYEQLLIQGKSADRDSKRWYQYDIEYEIEKIRQWSQRRIEFLDEYFK